MPEVALGADLAQCRAARPGRVPGPRQTETQTPEGNNDGSPPARPCERASALEARGLSKSFGGALVLDGLDVQVRQGEILALTGANGSGKTTLLRCLAGAYRPSQGQVFWLGRPVGSHPSLHRLVGLVDHESLLYRNLTVAENLLFAARMYGLVDPRQRVQTLLESTGLQPFGQHLVAQISQGMARRLSIARALVHDPSIVLMDEPFSGLDADGSLWLMRLLRQLRTQGRTICCVTHDVALVRALADRAVRLARGRVQELEPNAWDRSFGG